jgi:YgiT-type zinc finger domain-containing protein
MVPRSFDRPEPSYTCSECQAGQLRRRFVTYFTWLGEELITVPDFPAWVCDVCGRREYDPAALNHLSLLLSPNAGKTPAAHTRKLAKKPVVKEPLPRKSK